MHLLHQVLGFRLTWLLIQYFCFYIYVQPSGSTSTGRSVPPRGPKKPLEGRYVISEFEIATGRPLGEHANKYVGHYGYLVRDQIPISAREQREKRGAREISFVSDGDKELVWKAITAVFTFDTND